MRFFIRVKPGLCFGQQDVQYTQCGSHLVCVLGRSDHPAQTCQGVSQEGASEGAQGLKEGRLETLGKQSGAARRE